MIAYISIGNSDDKLTQAEWCRFVGEVDGLVGACPQLTIHGRWFSAPDRPWQNACWCVEWCVEFDPHAVPPTAEGQDTCLSIWLPTQLARLATKYRQDSISWARVVRTIFITPAHDPDRYDPGRQE